MKNFRTWLHKDWNETKVLFRCIPAFPFAILCAALIAMNFLANKAIVSETWISLDAGITVSWIAFLAGDMLVKRFGAKASIKVNVAAILIQLLAIGLLTIGANIPGYCDWVEFDSIFGAMLWPLAAGTAAFLIGISVNAFISKFILTRFENRTSFRSYAVASYVSTMIGQFIDNLGFALLFSVWQEWCDPHSIWMFAAVGAVVELLCQVILSPLGFKIAQNWRKHGVGQEYIDLVKEAQEVNMTHKEKVK